MTESELKACRSDFYSYYIDRHGCEPDDVGADREAFINFQAGWKARPQQTPVEDDRKDWKRVRERLQKIIKRNEAFVDIFMEEENHEIPTDEGIVRFNDWQDASKAIALLDSKLQKKE